MLYLPEIPRRTRGEGAIRLSNNRSAHPTIYNSLDAERVLLGPFDRPRSKDLVPGLERE